MDSEDKEGYFRFRKDGAKIPLAGKSVLQSVGICAREELSCGISLFSDEKQHLTMKGRHNMLGHIDSAVIKHLKKRGFIEEIATTVGSDLRCTVCCESNSLSLFYGKGSGGPKALQDIIHTDLQKRFHPNTTGMKYFHVFGDEATRDKGIVDRRLQTRLPTH